jgi:hypothetical protein
MPWSRRHGGNPTARYEVWVRDAHDGMVSDLSMVFKNSAEAEAYAEKTRKMGDYNVSIRPSSNHMPLGRDRVSLRDAGVKY